MALHLRRVAKQTWISSLRVLLLIFIFMLFCVAWLLGTEGGRITLVMKGLDAYQLFSGQTVELDGLRTSSLSSWHVNRIHWHARTDETSLTVDNVSLVWAWHYALQNRWWLERVEAERLTVSINPQETSGNKQLSDLYHLWSMIPAIRIDRLHIRDVALNRPRYPQLEGDFDAQVEVNWGAYPARFLMSMQDLDDHNNAALQLSVDDIDKVRLRGSLVANPDTAWTRWMKWDLPEAAEAQWDVEVDYSEPSHLAVQIERWSMPWKSHLLQASGQFTYAVDELSFHFDALDFEMDGQPADISGVLSPQQSDVSISVEQWPLEPIAGLFSMNDVQGQVSVNGTWHGGWLAPRFNGRAHAHGQWQTHDFDFASETASERSVLTINNGRLTMANNDLSLAGTIDWISEEVDIELEGAVQSDPVFRPWLTGGLADVQAGARITGAIRGDVHSPLVTLDAMAEGLWRDDIFSGRLTGQWQNGQADVEQMVLYSDLLQFKGQGHYQLVGHQWQAGLQVDTLTTEVLARLNIHFPVDFRGSAGGDFQLTGDAEDFALTGNAHFQGLWQDAPLNADAAIRSLTKQALILGNTRLRLAQSTATGSGEINWSKKYLDLTLAHEDWPLDTVAVWLPIWPDILDTFHVDLTGSTNITGHWTRPAIETDATVAGTWFEQALTGQLSTLPDTNTQWRIPQLTLQWLNATWQYEGLFAPYQLELDGTAQVTSLHSRWAPLLSREFTHSEKALPAEFDLMLGSDVSISGKLTEPVLSGQATLDGELSGEPMSMMLDIAQLNTQSIDITNASGSWGAGQWQVSGQYDWQQNQARLTVTTDSPDAYYLTPWLALAVPEPGYQQWLDHWQGSLQGQVVLDTSADGLMINGDLSSRGRLFDEEYQVQWRGNGQLNQTLSHDLTATWGVAEGSASLLNDASGLQGNMHLKWLNYEQLRRFLPTVPDNVMGFINLDLALSGQLSDPVYQADVSSVGQFQAKYAHRFDTSISLKGQGPNWTLPQAVFEIPGAVSVSLSGQGQGRQGEMLVEGVLPDTSYWITNEDIGTGEAGFRMSGKGDLFMPVLNGVFQWQSKNWPMKVESTWQTDGDEYDINSVFYSDQKSRVMADVTLSRLSLLELPTIWREAPFAASITVDTPLSVLDPFFISLPDVRLAGDVEGRLSLDGSLSDPIWQGQLQWLNGQVEHANYGTQVSNISVLLDASEKEWRITSSAQDNRTGSLSAQGRVSFEAQPDQMLAHNVDIRVEYNNAHLLNQAQMEAAIDGNLHIQGPYHNVLIDGQLKMNALNVQTDTFLSSGAPQLNIVTQDQLLNNFEQEEPFYWPQGNWQVSVVADQRVNLYGQGINAELEGEVRLSKDLYAPELSGQFDLVRGTYSGLGKIFQLTEGSIQIENSQIVLDISGINTMVLRIDEAVTSVEVTVRITGNQDELSLALTSDTDLEQDELLAQILFGKIIDDLDVLQAIQLANVVNNLRTGSTGFDLVGATREEIGLDSLAVDTATDEQGNLGFNISAGKYLNDFLYLEVEQQVGAERDSRGSLQYQLTPNTNLELYTQGENGEFDENGVELNWSWDY